MYVVEVIALSLLMLYKKYFIN